MGSLSIWWSYLHNYGHKIFVRPDTKWKIGSSEGGQISFSSGKLMLKHWRDHVDHRKKREK